LPSPAWMAWVWAPSGRGEDFALAEFLEGAFFMMAPFWAQGGGGSKDQFGGGLTAW
jgi:hypothetical protein